MKWFVTKTAAVRLEAIDGFEFEPSDSPRLFLRGGGSIALSPGDLEELEVATGCYREPPPIDG